MLLYVYKMGVHWYFQVAIKIPDNILSKDNTWNSVYKLLIYCLSFVNLFEKEYKLNLLI